MVIEGIEAVKEVKAGIQHVEVAEAEAVTTHIAKVLAVAVESRNQQWTPGAAGIVGM